MSNIQISLTSIDQCLQTSIHLPSPKKEEDEDEDVDQLLNEFLFVLFH